MLCRKFYSDFEERGRAAADAAARPLKDNGDIAEDCMVGTESLNNRPEYCWSIPGDTPGEGLWLSAHP